MNNIEILKEINDNLSQNKIFVLATITNVTGSSPRKIGAKMIVYPDSNISGTVGGGYFEKMVIDDCLKLIKSGTKHLHQKYNFSQSGENPTGMCCGGTADVFMEFYSGMNKLIIYGGGHVGKELAKLASNVGFQIMVVDDRDEVIETFKTGISTFKTDSDYKTNLPEVDSNSYLAVVTRSHKTDQAIIEQLIEKDCKYIGMIGSKSKINKLFKHLKEIGIDDKYIKRVHAPIGLDINAEGPFEIAVSILAELIAVKNKTPDVK